jgi:hypothetical protein
MPPERISLVQAITLTENRPDFRARLETRNRDFHERFEYLTES